MRLAVVGALAAVLVVALPACGGRSQSNGSQVQAGGDSGAGSCLCTLIGCDAGFELKKTPDDCCGTCVLACEDVSCTDQDCNAGSHMEPRDGECCPVCVKDDALPCADARKAYEDHRAGLLEPYRGSECLHEPECMLFFESNRCASTCGTPTSIDAAERITRELDAYAAENCSSCPRPIAQPCPSPPPMACVDGNCRFPESAK